LELGAGSAALDGDALRFLDFRRAWGRAAGVGLFCWLLSLVGTGVGDANVEVAAGSAMGGLWLSPLLFLATTLTSAPSSIL
jgi:hypothetical protein